MLTPTLTHVTINTGDSRQSPQSEVDPHVIAMLQAMLRSRRFELMPGYRCCITTDETDLLEARVSSETHQVLIWIAVAKHKSMKTDATWTAIGGRADAPAVPWCAAKLEPNLHTHPPEIIIMLGDFERCLAWAWLLSS